MAKLDLKRTLDGRLKRLHLYKNGLNKEDINSISWIPGFNDNKNVISLPTSIKTIYDVVQALPEKVELTSDMEEWKDGIEQQIKDLRAIKNQEVDEPQLKTEGLYDYQKYDVAFMERAKRCINAGQVGVGKDQPLSAKILTPNGWTTMGDIEVGDPIIGADGNQTKVTGTYPQGKNDVFEVKFTDGSSTQCGRDHLWNVNTSTRKSNGRPYRTKELKELMGTLKNSKGRTRHFIPLTRPINYKTKDLPIHPYALGVLLGDGALSVNGRVGLTNKSEFIINKVKRYLPNFLEFKNYSGSTNSYDYSIVDSRDNCKNWLIDKLKSLNLYKTYSDTKFIPSKYLRSSVKQRLHLLHGLLDTDSYVHSSGIEFYSTSEKISNQILSLVQSLGGVGRKRIKKDPKYSYKGEVKTGKDCYIIYAIKLPKYFSPLSFKEKLNRLNTNRFGPSRGIKEINYIGKRETKCISVENQDNLYLTDDYIVTHNTIEAIGWMNELPKDSKVLVVAKKSLTYNWYHEMKEWLLGEPKISLADGHKGSRKEALASDANHFIINFAMLRKNKYPSLFEEDWDLVIADEAHKIRNRKSQTSEGFARLSTERMGLLTGTPILNSPEELWHLLHVLYPKMFSSYWQFKKKYCKTKFNPFGYEDDVVGVKNKSFFHFVQDYLLVKRLKEKVLSDLPDMNFHTKVIELPKPQKEIYDQMQNEMFTVIKDKWLMAGTNLEQLIRLRQLALSPKIHDSDVEGGKTKFIKNWLEDNPEEKLVVFSNSKQYLYILREALSDYGALMITGDQKDELRYDNQDAFQEDDDHRVILLTYGAGCEGHTLTRANTLIRADMAWSPEINAQAAGRVHRITQTKEVDIIDLKAKDTIDENVFEILKVKQKKIDETWGKEG